MLGARMMMGAATGLRGADPYWADVVLAMHMDGANGSNVFTDEKSHTITPVGSPTISTADSKFGGASAYLPGGSGTIGLSFPTSLLWFGTQDFTIEFWASFAATAPYSYPYTMTTNAYNATSGFYCVVKGNGTGWGGTGTFNFIGCGGTPALASTSEMRGTGWHHIAICRQGLDFYLFIDGVLEDSVTVTTVTDFGGAYSVFGYDQTNNGSEEGYFDDLRVTLGVARYTANFTPPTSAFPNS